MMVKNKICHVIHSFDHIGGAENVIINLLNNFSSEIKQVVCSLTTVGKIQERVFNKNVIYYALNKKEGNDITLPFKLYKVFKNEEVSVVHLRGWATLLEGYLAAKFSSVSRIVYSEHGRHFDDVWNSKKVNVYVKRYLFNHVHRLMTVSSELKDEMRQLYGIQSPVTVIRNGVDSLKFQPGPKEAACQALGIDTGKPLIGIIGRLVPGKAVGEFLDNLCNHALDAQVIIVGTGPLSSDLQKKIVSNSLDSQVFMLGDRADIPEIMQALDVLAMPSLSEGLSNVILEAMSSGLPVVAFDAGGNKELIEHNDGGYLVPLRDWDSFFEKLLYLTANAQTARMLGQFNRNKVIENFSLEKMYDSYQELYFGNK